LEKSLVAIVYNEPVGPEGLCCEASRDILDQVQAVEGSLARLGMPAVCIPFTRDLRSFVHKVEEDGIQYAFNLCESVDEKPEWMGHPAAVLEILGVSYTGSSGKALELTTDKVLTKRLLEAAGIRTPNYAIYEGTLSRNLKTLRFPVIAKPRFQDASIGIDQDSIFADESEFRQAIPQLYKRFGSLLLEEYVSGREFNVSLFGYPSPQVMPIAEISFDEFPRGLYPIVGYRAKWDRCSFEYHHTPRIFPGDLPEDLETRIHQTAMKCFHDFMLRDYGRVDIRVDPCGEVYVLEINANPCISPDAGFPAALAQGGLTYDQFVRRLLGFVRMRREKAMTFPGESRKRLTTASTD
jgi:D-alanine-D-alanine ligase